ncbi:hypothetical protein Tco_0080544 [Tanacetum coccineum]
MVFSDSEVHNDKPCTKSCLKNYETLKKQYDDLLAKQLQTKFESTTYKRGLDTVEAQLVTYRKNEALNKLNLSYSSLDEFKEPEFKGYGPENSKKESNVVCEKESDNSKENSDESNVVCEKESDNSKENSDKSLVKEQESKVKSSFVEGYDEEQDESITKPKNKTVIPTAAKIEKPVKKSVRQANIMIKDLLPVDAQGIRMVNSYLSDFKQLDGGYVNFEEPKNGVAERRNRTLIEADKVNTVRPRIVNTARSYRTPVNTVRPRVINTARQNRTSVNAARANGFNAGKPQHDDKGFVDSGCSRHMTGNIAYLSDFKQFDGGYVAFGGGAYGGKISGTSEENSQECIVMPIWKDSSYFDSPTENVDNGEPKTADDAQKQDEDGLNNENAEQERFSDDSSSKDVNSIGQQVNTASPDVNTGSLKLNVVGPSTSTARSNKENNTKEEPKVDLGNITNSYIVPNTPNTRIHKDHPIDNVIGEVQSTVQTRRMLKPTSEQGFLSDIKPTSIAKALFDSSWVEAIQEELLQFKLQQVWIRVDLPKERKAIETNVSSKQERWEWEIVFLYGTIEEEVYVTQPPGFKDLGHPDKVYKVVKKEDGIFISQDKYVAEILKKFNYSDVKSTSTPVDLEKPLVKDGDADDVDVINIDL